MENEKNVTADETVTMKIADLKQIIDEKISAVKTEIDSKISPTVLLNTGRTEIKLTTPVNKGGTLLRMLGNAQLKNISIEKSFIEQGIEINNFIPESQIKLINASVGSQGGYMIPEYMIDEIIPALRNKAVIRSAGARVYDLPNGNGNIGAITTGISAYWKGENTTKTVSTPVFGSINLNVKTLAVDVPISNKFIRYSQGNNDVALMEDLQQGLITGEDFAYLEGTGSAFSPKGLLYLTASANKVAMTGTPDSAKILADLLACKARLVANNMPMSKPVWILDESVKAHLESRTDSNSNPMIYARSLMENNTIFGYPVFSTNSISSASANVYLVDIAQCVIGQGQGLTIEFVPNGDYYDGTKTVSGRSTDTSVYTAMLDVDFAIKYDKACSIITGVTWGH